MKNLLLILTFAFNLLAHGQDAKFGKITASDFGEAQNYSELEHDAVVLHREKNVSFVTSSNRFQYIKVFERILILSDEGLDYATKQIPLYRFKDGVEKVINMKAASYYLKENGTVHQEKVRKSESFLNEYDETWNVFTMTLPLVQKGSIIEFEYTIERRSMYIDNLVFQDDIPIKYIQCNVDIPEYSLYTFHSNPLSSLVPVKQQIPGKVTYTARDVPALKAEPRVKNYDRFRSYVQMELAGVNTPMYSKTFTTTWDEISSEIFKRSNFGKQLTGRSFYKTDLNEHLETNSLDKENLSNIYHFVKSKVQWNGEYGWKTQNGVRDAYKNGSGNVADVNLLLVNMLNYAGFEAYPVLIATKSRGIPLYPTLNGFNYVAAAVQLDEELILLDATIDKLAVGQLPDKVRNWQGRLVKNDGTSLFINLYPTIHSNETQIINASITPDGKAIGDVSKRVTEYMALKYRNVAGDQDIEDQSKNIQEFIGEDGLGIKEFRLENIENLEEPVILRYDFIYNQTIEKIDDYLFVSPLLFTSNSTNPFKLKERELPLELGYPIITHTIVNIDIPDGYKIKYLPSNEKHVYLNNKGSYQLLIKEIGNRIQISAKFIMNDFIIMQDKYSTFKEFYESIVQKDKEKIVLERI